MNDRSPFYHFNSSIFLSQAERFLEEITNSTVGLTGMRFFYLTRSLILSVAGTVVTYEIVLVQFQILTPGSSRHMCGHPIKR